MVNLGQILYETSLRWNKLNMITWPSVAAMYIKANLFKTRLLNLKTKVFMFWYLVIWMLLLQSSYNNDMIRYWDLTSLRQGLGGILNNVFFYNCLEAIILKRYLLL